MTALTSAVEKCLRKVNYYRLSRLRESSCDRWRCDVIRRRLLVLCWLFGITRDVPVFTYPSQYVASPWDYAWRVCVYISVSVRREPASVAEHRYQRDNRDTFSPIHNIFRRVLAGIALLNTCVSRLNVRECHVEMSIRRATTGQLRPGMLISAASYISRYVTLITTRDEPDFNVGKVRGKRYPSRNSGRTSYSRDCRFRNNYSCVNSVDLPVFSGNINAILK